MNRFYGRVLHRDAPTELPAGAQSLRSLKGHRYALVITYRRNGEGVSTPVWFALADGRLYASTHVDSGKVKRIRREPRVLVAACTARGKPLGDAVPANARVLMPSEARHAELALSRTFGVVRRLYRRLLGTKATEETAYLEITERGAGTADSE